MTTNLPGVTGATALVTGASRGIGAAIAPGSTETERLTTLMPPEARSRLAAAHPLGRLGTPDDIARAALFLLSDNASWITGATLDVNGGRIMA